MPEQVQDDLPPLPAIVQQAVNLIVEEARTEDWRASLGEADDALDRRLELTGRHLHILTFAVLREMAEGYREVLTGLEALRESPNEVKDVTVKTIRDHAKIVSNELILVWEEIGGLNRRLEDLRRLAEREV